jgi:hypothetical protein
MSVSCFFFISFSRFSGACGADSRPGADGALMVSAIHSCNNNDLWKENKIGKTGMGGGLAPERMADSLGLRATHQPSPAKEAE